ncbi:helix-turn-helix domain-containing protein [Inquilinus limosus]|uniref:helix-turn-helix domain-containing protein n=1 Tax=Inquilinus limosus TaxID=171674 RepID=UPI003F16160D
MLSKALRLVRVYHDLSLVEAAERVGLSKSYVSELEKGHKKVTMEVLEKYAEAFDMPMSSLMLFAERSEGGQRSTDVKAFVADKTLKMLDWFATLTADRDSHRNE